MRFEESDEKGKKMRMDENEHIGILTRIWTIKRRQRGNSMLSEMPTRF